MTNAHLSELSWVKAHLPPPNGIDLHILCPVYGMEESEAHFDWEGAHWHCFRLKRFEPLFLRRRFWFSIKPFIKKLSPDIVHGWGGETGWGLLATYISRNAVISVQGLLRMLSEKDDCSLSGRLRLVMEAMTYRRAKVCLCESNVAQDNLMKLYGINGKVAPQPLRKEFLVAESLKSEDLARTQPIIRFLFVGQRVARKGFYDVQKAFRKVKEVFPSAKLLLITEGFSADEIVDFMKTATCLVLPSYGETGPTVVKEAISMGLWPICYDNTGATELLLRYNIGCLVPTGDIESLALAMIRVARRGHVEIKNRISKAQAKIRSDLSPSIAWTNLLQIYRGLNS